MHPFNAIKRSLVLRLILPISAVIVLAVSLHIFLLSSPKDIYERKFEESERLGHMVEAMVFYDMQRNALHDFQAYLDMFPFEADLITIRLFDHNGYLRYAVGDTTIGARFDRSSDPACIGCHQNGKASIPQQNLRRDARGRYLFQTDFPLKNVPSCRRCHESGDAYLGNLLTELALSPVELRLLHKRRLMILVGSLVMLTAIGAVWLLLHRQVVKPIKELVRIIERSKKGDFSQRLRLERRDEIGFLVESFNDMIDTMAQFQSQLEAQVESRTRELESSRLQLLMRENLASLGRLAAGVAHELGNPLTGISSIVQLVKRRKKDDPFIVEQLDLVQGEIERLARLSRQMVDLARPENPRQTVFDIRPALSKAYQIARLDRKLKKRTMKMPPPGNPLFVEANEDAVIQILMNLLFNAADFTEEKGTIEVTLKVNGDDVEVRVSDDGTPIPEEHQRRIFDPFFSGKKTGAGTGLGLSISYSLARSFHGDLILESSNAEGTTFLLKVPYKRWENEA